MLNKLNYNTMIQTRKKSTKIMRKKSFIEKHRPRHSSVATGRIYDAKTMHASFLMTKDSNEIMSY